MEDMVCQTHGQVDLKGLIVRAAGPLCLGTDSDPQWEKALWGRNKASVLVFIY